MVRELFESEQRAAEELQPLPGEDRDTPFAEEARLWVAVYAELLGFTQGCLQRLQSSDPDINPADWRADRAYLEGHRRRLEERLAFWQRRCWDLGGIDFDPRTRLIRNGGHAVLLTPREAKLFQFLLEHPGKFFSPQQLLLQAWHDSRLSEAQLRSYVVRLRRRITELGLPCSLNRQPGLGYGMIMRSSE